jgi:RNA polymerase sigma-70 factor (sigma-E family)
MAELVQPVPTGVAATSSVTQATFDDVYRAEFGDLVRLAASITGSAAVAEDVVQDAFAKLYVRFGRIERPAAYLRRSVVNGCVGRFRRHRREDLVADHRDSAAASDEPTERLELARRLAALPARQRAVVVLRVQHGHSEAEVAEILGCRSGTVGSLLHRALAALRIDEGDLP